MKRRRRDVCLAVLKCFNPLSHLRRLARPNLYWWTWTWLTRWPVCGIQLNCHLLVISYFMYFFCKYIYVFIAKCIVWKHHPRFDIAFIEKSLSTNISGLGTTSDVPSDYDSTKDYQHSKYHYQHFWFSTLTWGDKVSFFRFLAKGGQMG